MTRHDPAAERTHNTTNDTASRLSRRHFVGMAAAGAAAAGLAGCSLFAQTARAQADVNFADSTVTLDPGEDVDGVTVIGTVGIDYDVPAGGVDHIDCTANLFRDDGGFVGSDASHTFDDIDAEAGHVDTNFELDALSGDEAVDPDPGTFNAYDYTVEVYVVVEDADGIVVERVVDDDATLRVERESLGDDDGGNDTDDDNGGGDQAPSADVSAGFQFDVETA